MFSKRNYCAGALQDSSDEYCGGLAAVVSFLVWIFGSGPLMSGCGPKICGIIKRWV